MEENSSRIGSAAARKMTANSLVERFVSVLISPLWVRRCRRADRVEGEKPAKSASSFLVAPWWGSNSQKRSQISWEVRPFFWAMGSRQ